MFRIIVFLFGIVLASHALAKTLPELTCCNSGMLIGLSAGPAWASGNKTQTLQLKPDITKTYTGDNDNAAFPAAELFIGWQQPLRISALRESPLGQLGVTIAGAGNAKLTGDIWEDADPEFNNYNYSYKVKHARVAIAGRLIGHCDRFLEPYISASIGVGFNRAYDFTISPKIISEVPAPPFQANTTITFTYTLGIGLQKTFNSNLQAAIGYEFFDWGKTELSRAAGQTLNQGLSLNHLYVNQLMFSLYYLV